MVVMASAETITFLSRNSYPKIRLLISSPASFKCVLLGIPPPHSISSQDPPTLFPASQLPLDLIQRLSLRFRHEHESEQRPHETNDREDPKGRRRPEVLDKEYEAKGHNESGNPVERDSNTCRASFHLRREQLTNHHPRNRPVA